MWIFFHMLMILFILVSCAEEEKKVSTGKPLPDSGFRAELRIKEMPSEIRRGEKVVAVVTVKNISDQTWPSKGDSRGYYGVNLGYQLFDEADHPLTVEIERTFLPKDLNPSDSLELSAVLKAPDKPGKYTIRFDMVQEAVAWFGHKNKDNYSNGGQIVVGP